MTRLKHLLCQLNGDYLWHVKDPEITFWIVNCTKCGYEKRMD